MPEMINKKLAKAIGQFVVSVLKSGQVTSVDYSPITEGNKMTITLTLNPKG